MKLKDTITAKNLVLVDSAGKPRIVLSADWPNGFAGIDLISPTGAGFKLWVDADGLPKLAVQREDSRFAVTFALKSNSEPVLTFYDATGKPMIRVGRNEDADAPSIDIFKNGDTVWSSDKLLKVKKKRMGKSGRKKPRK